MIERSIKMAKPSVLNPGLLSLTIRYLKNEKNYNFETSSTSLIFIYLHGNINYQNIQVNGSDDFLIVALSWVQ